MQTCTPTGAPSPVVQSDPSTWTNAAYPYYVVQALTRDERSFEHEGLVPDSERLQIFRDDLTCRWMQERRENEFARACAVASVAAPEIPFTACLGVDGTARRGVALERKDALHAIYVHYLWPNLSICRFRSRARGEYATDLIFEIDAHGVLEPFSPLQSYAPFIEAAVRVGRRIFDFLVDDLKVPPGYITTSVTRMGASVVVDWRAVGPRRVWELCAAVRWIECQVFREGELSALGNAIRADVNIDTRVYSAPDQPRIDEAGVNHFIGKWLRPLGALHSKSSRAMGWARKTPVPHDLFKAEEAELLTMVSRGKSPEIASWLRPELLDWKTLARWPEARAPKADQLVEGVLQPAWDLIRLIDRDDLEREVRPEFRDELRRGRLRSTGAIASRDVAAPRVDRDAVTSLVEFLGLSGRDRGDHLEFDCPRASCKSRDRKAMLFLDSGVFYCHRCTPGRGISVGAFAAEMGASQVLPRAVQTSAPLRRILREDAPPNPFDGWPTLTRLERHESRSLEEGRRDQDEVLDAFLGSPTQRILFLTSGTGIGKTTAVLSKAEERGVRLRVFCVRDDSKEDVARLLPGAKVLSGRRAGVNCSNEALSEVESRQDPIGETLCSWCPTGGRCKEAGYLSQFETPHDRHLIVHHNIGLYEDMQRFSNEADVDFVDEDAFAASLQNVDIDERELLLLQVAREYNFEKFIDEDGSFLLSDPVPVTRRWSSPRLEVVVTRVLDLLSQDDIIRRDPASAKTGTIQDLALAKHLLNDATLRHAVATFDDADFASFDEGRIHLLELSRVMVCPPTAAKGDPAWQPRTIPCEDHERRPMRILRELIGALRDLLADYELERARTSALQAVRRDRASRWTLRLTVRRPFLASSKKIIHATATAVPERMRLLYGDPTLHREWVVHRAAVPDPVAITCIADHSYAVGPLTSEEDKAKKLRERLFETARTLVRHETERTGLPVAVIGPSEIMNLFNVHVLGKLDASLLMPWRSERLERATNLRALTEPVGYIAGYAYGVSGSNAFAVEGNGFARFVRSLVVLGNPVPNLRSFASDHRGTYAGESHVVTVEPEGPAPAFSQDVDTLVDWSFAWRTVAFAGTEDDDGIIVRGNVAGYADARANAVLAGVYEAEVIQILGRMRSVIPDPVTPEVEPRAWIIAGLALPGVRVSRVIDLEELRADLGLDVEQKKRRGRPPKLSLEDRVRRDSRKRGRGPTIRWLVRVLTEMGSGAPVSEAKAIFQGLGIEYGRSEAGIAMDAFRRLRGSPRKSL